MHLKADVRIMEERASAANAALALLAEDRKSIKADATGKTARACTKVAIFQQFLRSFFEMITEL